MKTMKAKPRIQAQSLPPAIPVVRTQELDLVDTEGRTRAHIFAAGEHVMFSLSDTRGHPRLMLAYGDYDDKDGSQIILSSASGRKELRLRLDSKGRLHDEGEISIVAAPAK